jgi:hypothetical protein
LTPGRSSSSWRAERRSRDRLGLVIWKELLGSVYVLGMVLIVVDVVVLNTV